MINIKCFLLFSFHDILKQLLLVLDLIRKQQHETFKLMDLDQTHASSQCLRAVNVEGSPIRIINEDLFIVVVCVCTFLSFGRASYAFSN